MERFEIVIQPQKGREVIGLTELTIFLKNFTHAYHLAYKYSYLSGYQTQKIDYLEIKSFKKAIKNKDSEIFLNDSIKIEELDFSSITTNSPLKFIGYCTGVSMVALTLAVAVAGGEVDLEKKIFKVESLADAGIKIYETISDDLKKDRSEKSKNKPKS